MKFKSPQFGDTRHYVWFAWYPVRLGDGQYYNRVNGTLVWLEWVTVYEEFMGVCMMNEPPGGRGKWCVTKITQG